MSSQTAPINADDIFHTCRTAMVTTDDPVPIHRELAKSVVDVNDFGFHGNDRSVGQTLLMVAAKYGRTRCIVELVDRFGADVHVAGGVGLYTALHYAAFHGHPAAVRYGGQLKLGVLSLL